MKSCPRCQKKLATKAGLKQHMDSVHNGAPQRKGGVVPARTSGKISQPRTMGSNLGDGSITLSRSELLTSVDVQANADTSTGAIQLYPTPQNMTWLAKLAAAYDQIVWHSARVFFKPACGTTRNGSLLIGVDWDPTAADTARATVQSCTPVTEAPVWQQSQLTLPSTRLQSRKYYFLKGSPQAQDKAPGVLLYHAKVDKESNQRFYGDIWIDYRVTLQGPSA